MHCSLLDLSKRCQNGFQENPEAIALMRTFKQRLNPAVRQRGFCKARFQEKLLKLCKEKPYRKPTQVVSSSRVRRTSERSPRNSAKKQP